MQSDILKKIDLLVEMAGSTSNIDTVKAELNEINKEIADLKNELSLLMEENGSRYFKASEKLVDENIKASLESRIKKQENTLKNTQKEIDKVVLEESELHNKILELKDKISTSEDYITILNDRISDQISDDKLAYYKAIIVDANKKLTDMVSSLNELETSHEKILEKLNYLNIAKDEIAEKLNSDRAKLSETCANLMNPSSYIDENLKNSDSVRIDEIKEKMAGLEKRKLEILTDPVMIASDAKDLILDDDRTSALNKVKELVTIVSSKPFMNMNSGGEFAKTLKEELENASNSRDEFASLIDSKDYSNYNNEFIRERIEYLNESIKDLEEKIKYYKERINNIDNEKFPALIDKINKANQTSLELQSKLIEYEKIINDNKEEKTPKRRAVLTTAFEKKKEELEVINKIIDKYLEEQKELISKAHNIEVEQIADLEKQIESKNAEIEELKRSLVGSSNVRDVLAIENDKNHLKELDENVKSIKHRQKYTQTPSEIFDEIEIYLGTMDVIENDDIPTMDEEKIESFKEFEFDDLPTLLDIPTEEKFKVVNIESLTSDDNDKNPFLIGDYKEDNSSEVL